MDVEVIRGDDADGIARARAIRREVFVGEFAVTDAEEIDALDDAPGTVHVVAVVDGVDVGTARLVTEPDRPGVVHATRVAVRKSARGLGVGRAVMAALEQVALAECAVGRPPTVRLELSVMEHAVGFYAALGYEVGAERRVEVRIPHRDAHKVLTEPGAAVRGV